MAKIGDAPNHQVEFPLCMRSLLQGAAVLIATADAAPSSARAGMLRALGGACLIGPPGAPPALRRPRMGLCITAWHWVGASAPGLQVCVTSRSQVSGAFPKLML